MKPSKKIFQEEIRGVFEKVKKHTQKYSIEIGGKSITIFPNVFSPKYFTDSLWFAENLADIVGQSSLLEIGTGTGIIALFSALNGANVAATDLNPNAIKNAKYNFEKYEVQIGTYSGDMYEPLPKDSRFDFIFWNHPFNRGNDPNEEILLRAGFDFQYKSLDKYIADAHKHLTEDGRLLLGTGSFAEIDKIEEIASSHGYSLGLLRKGNPCPIQTEGNFMNDYRIYELKRQP